MYAEHGSDILARALAALSGFKQLHSRRSLLSGLQSHESVLVKSEMTHGVHAFAKMLKYVLYVLCVIVDE